jgi:hypothetical protein
MIGSFLRGLHRRDGAARSASGAEGGMRRMSPMVDGWMGDDWFHYGAFRQSTSTTSPSRPRCERRRRGAVPRGLRRLRCNFLRAGSAGDFAALWRASISSPSGASVDGASGLRCVLAGAGARQACGCSASVRRSHHVAAGPVGPGRHVGRHPLLRGRGGPGTGREQQ